MKDERCPNSGFERGGGIASRWFHAEMFSRDLGTIKHTRISKMTSETSNAEILSPNPRVTIARISAGRFSRRTLKWTRAHSTTLSEQRTSEPG